MFNPTQQEVRSFFCQVWRKQQTKEILTPLESMAAHWISAHPEYQNALLQESEFIAKDNQTNPFLHLSMHLAITEQISIDQPIGIRAAYQHLLTQLGSAHNAQHTLMECLGTALWEAQRNNKPLDTEAYLACIKRHLSG